MIGYQISLTGVSSATEIEISLPNGLYHLTYFGLEFVSGTGTTFQPSLSERTGAPVGGSKEVDKWTYASTKAKTEYFQDQIDPGVPFNVVDEKIYLKPFVDAGADNVFTGFIELTPAGKVEQISN